MAVKLRTKRPDPALRQIVAALEKYGAAHPHAEIEVYRHGSVSVRIRIIDPDFKGKSRADRDDEVWAAFEELPDEVVADITLLLLYTPSEAKKSFANMEFDNPVPSRL